MGYKWTGQEVANEDTHRRNDQSSVSAPPLIQRLSVLEQYDRLVRLASALLSTFDWDQLLMCVVQTFGDDELCVGARLWSLGSNEATEIACCGEMLASPPRPALNEVSFVAESFIVDGGIILAPLRSLGAAAMALEFQGIEHDALDFVDDVAKVAAGRAAFISAVEPNCRVLPAVRGTEEVSRAVRGFSTALQPLLRHDRLTLFLLTAGHRAIERFAVAGAVPLPSELLITPISEFGLREVITRGKSHLTDDLGRDGTPISRGARVLIRAGFRSSLSVPLLLDGRCIGILQLLSRSAGFYRAGDVQVAQDIANHATPFVDHLRRQESVRPAALREAIETERTRLACYLARTARGALIDTQMSLNDLASEIGPVQTRNKELVEKALKLAASACHDISSAICDVTPPALRSRSFEQVLHETLDKYSTGADGGTILQINGNVTIVSMTARRMVHAVLCAALDSAHSAGSRIASVSLTIDDDIILNITSGSSVIGSRAVGIGGSSNSELQALIEYTNALGGRLYRESTPVRGNTLIFELPRTQPIRRDLEDERWFAPVPEGELAQSARVFVVDPQGLRRAGLTHFLDAQPELRVVGHTATLGEAQRSLAWLQPEVVFVEAESDSAPDTVRQVHQFSPNSAVIGLASHPSVALANEVILAGAAGVLRQGLGRDDLLVAIFRAVRGEKVSTDAVGMGPSSPAPPDLNSREYSVMKLIVDGYTNAEIGAKLYLAPKTIERHVASVMRKLGARNRAHLVALSIGAGLVEAPWS